MLHDDFEDLLGDLPADDPYDLVFEDEPEPPHASGGARIKESLTEKGANLAMHGAPPGWFAAVLGMGRSTVQKKLATLPPMRVVGNGTKLYAVKDAMPYLVQPHNLKEMLTKMSPRDLPMPLRKEFWGARKLEQQVRKEAGDLWSSADVHKAFGDIMKLIKSTALLWTDELDEATGLTAEQVKMLDNLIRDLLRSVGEQVEQYAMEGVTKPHEAEFDDDGVTEEAE